MPESEALVKAAKSAMEHAYAPYSNFKVGAAVLAKSGRMYSGCNVENASYGLSVCAERTAVFNAVCAGEREITAVAIAAPGEPAFPCGACRQVLAEFAPKNGDMTIYLISDQGIEEHLLATLFPNAFKLME